MRRMIFVATDTVPGSAHEPSIKAIDVFIWKPSLSVDNQSKESGQINRLIRIKLYVVCSSCIRERFGAHYDK